MNCTEVPVDRRFPRQHPSGLIDIELETSGTGVKMTVLRAAVVRTARKIMDGQLFVSASVWPATE